MKMFILLALIAITIAAPAKADPGPKIGVVNLQKAVSESREGIAARNDVLKKTEQLNTELKTLQADFETMKNVLEKDGAKMSAELREEKEQQLLQKGREFQSRSRDAQEGLKQLEADHVQKLVNKLALLIGKIGDEGAFSVILEQNAGVRYFNKALDITPLLVQKADESYKTQDK